MHSRVVSSTDIIIEVSGEIEADYEITASLMTLGKKHLVLESLKSLGFKYAEYFENNRIDIGIKQILWYSSFLLDYEEEESFLSGLILDLGIPKDELVSFKNILREVSPGNYREFIQDYEQRVIRKWLYQKIEKNYNKLGMTLAEADLDLQAERMHMVAMIAFDEGKYSLAASICKIIINDFRGQIKEEYIEHYKYTLAAVMVKLYFEDIVSIENVLNNKENN